MVVFFLIGALALLVALILFGFVGCDYLVGIEGASFAEANYPDVIQNTAGLVAYWRLGEPEPEQYPTTGGYAKDDATGNYPGDYTQMIAAQADSASYSPGNSGILALGQPGILTLSTNTCMFVNGGYMEVPYHPELNPMDFTFEAWVEPDPSIAQGYYYCLVESAGGYSLSDELTQGWGLYLGPSAHGATDGPLWQVCMGDGNKYALVDGAVANQPALLRLTYLVLVYDSSSNNLLLFFYYPDYGMHLDDVHNMLAFQASPSGFQANQTGNFTIGASSLFYPGSPSQRYFPFFGKIQEVAFYNIALVKCKPNGSVDCSGLVTLASHETSGGDL